MARSRPYPALEHLEVRYTSELQEFPTSPIPRLLDVTNDETAAQRRLQERTLLHHAAGLPSQDFMPGEGPTDPPLRWVSIAASESDRRLWREQCITTLENQCRRLLSPLEARDAGCVHCNRRNEEVDLYRCVMCRTNFVCWDHAIVPACMEGLEILLCAMHGRITPGPGSWNPPGGWNHPGALRVPSDRGLAPGFDQTALAELRRRPDLEERRGMSPRTRLHLQRLEAEAGVSGYNRLWRTFHGKARQVRLEEVQEWENLLLHRCAPPVALRSAQGEPAAVDMQSAEALLPRTPANQQAVALMRRDAAEREAASQASRSSTWGGPSPAEAGVGPGRSDRVLAALQSSIGVEGVTDPRRPQSGAGPPERPAPPAQQAPPGPPHPDPADGVHLQTAREDLEARQAYGASRPSELQANDGGLAQDLFALGELGDTPIPNAMDVMSSEEFLAVLETTLQARQA
eukprot:1057714-Amphidinium_carterae.1